MDQKLGRGEGENVRGVQRGEHEELAKDDGKLRIDQSGWLGVDGVQERKAVDVCVEKNTKERGKEK